MSVPQPRPPTYTYLACDATLSEWFQRLLRRAQLHQGDKQECNKSWGTVDLRMEMEIVFPYLL